MEWNFSQVFGERAPGEDVEEVDIITAMGFDASGDYLAVGDRGGRVVIFERKDGKHTSNQYQPRTKLEELDFTPTWNPEFQYKTEFQSHEPEFDYLKSLEIEEKINKIRWCATPNGSLFILSTNNKTIKLWKVKERKVKKVKEMDSSPYVSSENALLAEKSFMTGQDSNGHHSDWTDKMGKNMSPTQYQHDEIVDLEDTAQTRCRKAYAHAHEFNINSISTNSDCETFISADDLRINLWNLEISGQCFNIIDMKPSNMEDLTEVITIAEFHPIHCNFLAYGSSRGFIRLVDMRQSALCDHSAIILEDGGSRGSKSFFTEIVASISDMKFSKDGRYILSRDYMNLKLWDMHMDSSPVAIYKIHENLRPKFILKAYRLNMHANMSLLLSPDINFWQLCELYDNDCIFDKFACCLSGDGMHYATGSYSNHLRIFSHGAGSDEGITIEASKHPVRKPVLHAAPRTRRSSLSNLTRRFYRHGNDNSSSGNNDFSCNLNSKLLHLAWHPEKNLIACAAGNSLFMYHA
ncbi:serine/threonine protein phosphatase 2A 55 kDa regulatory subunit B beta isoform isoform X2 [Cannabis sativa]|uniref:serine/threonine protein phosphatase 2A 55 kDa regulatory subunit B beta isoform isoform X2 n=1 Tax=Cannabis sativa TaxID=3483 RepID=UPI0029CA1BC8|nr:serine/threonine protein phosphatase 2A 55 kDa regulatory subunit B beta isoform isoform X2 [Cannabis sativa]